MGGRDGQAGWWMPIRRAGRFNIAAKGFRAGAFFFHFRKNHNPATLMHTSTSRCVQASWQGPFFSGNVNAPGIRGMFFARVRWCDSCDTGDQSCCDKYITPLSSLIRRPTTREMLEFARRLGIFPRMEAITASPLHSQLDRERFGLNQPFDLCFCLAIESKS